MASCLCPVLRGLGGQALSRDAASRGRGWRPIPRETPKRLWGCSLGAALQTAIQEGFVEEVTHPPGLSGGRSGD